MFYFPRNVLERHDCIFWVEAGSSSLGFEVDDMAANPKPKIYMTCKSKHSSVWKFPFVLSQNMSGLSCYMHTAVGLL
jgi:hypothetical protein